VAQRHLARWAVQVEGPADPADLKGVGGLPFGNRLCARRSQCMSATEASAECHDHGREEADDECPKVARWHAAILAA
jgi:hypothetical protein